MDLTECSVGRPAMRLSTYAVVSIAMVMSVVGAGQRAGERASEGVDGGGGGGEEGAQI